MRGECFRLYGTKAREVILNPFKRIAATNRAIDESQLLADESTALVDRYGAPDEIDISAEETASRVGKDAAKVLSNSDRIRVLMTDSSVVKTTSERAVLPWLYVAEEMATWAAEVLRRIHQKWPGAVPTELRRYFQ